MAWWRGGEERREHEPDRNDYPEWERLGRARSAAQFTPPQHEDRCRRPAVIWWTDRWAVGRPMSSADCDHDLVSISHVISWAPFASG